MSSIMLKYYTEYKEFKNTDSGRSWSREREVKKKLLASTFSKQILKEASDKEFVNAFIKVLSNLWAMAVWTKREQRINKIIERNGTKKLREELYELIYGNTPFENRFDRFLSNIWGLGVAAITEILCFVEPQKYAMWNKKIVMALNKLGKLEEVLRVLGYRGNRIPSILSGKQYLRITSYLGELKKELERLSGDRLDFLELDYFLYYVAEVAEEITIERTPRKETISTHEEAQYYLLKLGQLLGYVTHVAKQDRGKIVYNEALGEIADISELPQWLILYSSIRNPDDIDVLWLDSTGERLLYAFEVSHTTDITKDATALRDLASISNKVFIVAPDNRQNEFDRLKKSAQFKYLIRNGKLGFIPYSELREMYERAKNLRELLDKAGIRIQ